MTRLYNIKKRMVSINKKRFFVRRFYLKRIFILFLTFGLLTGCYSKKRTQPLLEGTTVKSTFCH